MITFTKLGEYGRLGNQLWQYAAIKGLAKELNTEFKLPNIKKQYWHGQNCLLDNFNISCDPLEETDVIDRTIVEPFHPGGYAPSVKLTLETSEGNTDLIGYFQNTKYFSNIEDEIKEELTPKKNFIKDAKKYINSFISNEEEVVSIHLRRGDNTTNMYSDSNIFDKETIFGAYLLKAMKHFTENKYKFLVFTGGSITGNDEDDITWVKSIFDSYDRFIVSDSNDPMVDFSRMMCCNHNILCHATSFGWWTGYLNKNEDKKVIAPTDYHMDRNINLTSGFFPEGWILE